MSDQNKRLAQRAIDEVWNQGNYQNLDELAASDVVIHTSGVPGDIHGHEGITQFFGGLRSAFPDLHFTIEDQVAEGDRVVTRWVARGTHQGAFQGIPATGTRCAISGIDIDRIAGGKVVECWTNADFLSLLQQLGAVPSPDETEYAAG